MQAEARLVESRNAFERAKPLQARPATWRRAPTTSASRPRARPRRSSSPPRDGLKVAEAEKAQIEAQRRELDLAARPHRGGGAGRRHHQPPHGAHRRLSRRAPPSRCSASSPTARWSSTPRSPRRAWPPSRIGQPARVEVAGVGDDRRHRAPGLARGRQEHAARPRAHLSSATTRPARRRLRPRHDRDRQRPRARRAGLRHPLRPGGRLRAGGARQPRRDAHGSRPGWRPARWPRCARA